MITKLTKFSEFHEISCVLSAFFTGVGSGVGKIPAFLANTADGLLIQQGQPSLRAPRIQGSGNDVDRAVRDFLVSYRVLGGFHLSSVEPSFWIRWRLGVLGRECLFF